MDLSALTATQLREIARVLGPQGAPAEPDIDPELAALRDRMRAHRAHSMPDREDKARLAERYLRIERDNEQLRTKIAAATNSLANTFDRIVVLLTERGYITDIAEAPRDHEPPGKPGDHVEDVPGTVCADVGAACLGVSDGAAAFARTVCTGTGLGPTHGGDPYTWYP